MAVLYRAGTSSITGTINKPTGTEQDDLLILLQLRPAATSIPAPSGFVGFAPNVGVSPVYINQATYKTQWERQERFAQYIENTINTYGPAGENAVFLNWYDSAHEISPSPTYNSGYRYVLRESFLTENTRQVAVPTNAGYQIWYAFAKFAGASEPSSYTITSGCMSFLHAISGAKNVFGSRGSSLSQQVISSLAVPGRTLTAGDRYFIFALGFNMSTNPAIMVPSGLTEDSSLTADPSPYKSRQSTMSRPLTANTTIPPDYILNFSTPSAGAYLSVALVSNNRAPTAPTGVELGGAANGGQTDLAEATWIEGTFNDPDRNDIPSGIGVRRSVGGGAYSYWNGTDWSAGSSFFVPTTNNFLDFPAGAWANGTTYSVGMRFRDNDGLEGAWSTDISVTGSARPTATILSPSGTITASLPTVRFEYEDAEGDPMTGYAIATFTKEATEVLDWSPEFSNHLWRTERDWTFTTVERTSDVYHPDGDYVVAVRVWQEDELASLWVLQDFTVAAPPVAIPQLSAPYDPSINAFRLTALLPANQLTAKQADLRDGIEGWIAGNTNTSTPTGVVGVGMKVVASGPDEVVIRVQDPIETAPSAVYSEYAEFALAEGSDVAQWFIRVTQLDDDDQEISTVISPIVTELPTVLAEEPIPPGMDNPYFSLRYGSSAAYFDQKVLQGATIDEDVLAAMYVQMYVVATPPKVIKRVEWYYREVGSGTWIAYRLTDSQPPYNMEGTVDGVPFTTFPDDADYQIRALVIYTDDTTEETIANWRMTHSQVTGPVIPDYRIETSYSPNPFPNSIPLNGTSITSPFYPHLAWEADPDTDPTINYVNWYWRAGTTGTWILGRPLATDLGAPYEFSSTPPTDPALFGSSGQYQMRAVVTFVDVGITPVERIVTFSTNLLVNPNPDIEGETLGVEPRLLTSVGTKWVGTFDDADWKVDWGNPSTVNSYTSQYSVTTPPVPGGGNSGKALKVHANARGGAYNDGLTAFGIDFRPKFSQLSIPAMTEGYLRYRVLFPQGFNFYEGGKLPGFSSIPSANSETYTSSGGTMRADSWSGRLLFVSGGRIKTYFYAPYGGGSTMPVDSAGKPRGIAKQWTTPSLTTGVWHTIELYYKMNSTGARNGIFRGYLNGVLGMTLTDMQWSSTSNPSQPINQLFFSSFFGGPTSNIAAMDWYFDDVVISSTPVGLRQ
jgi:hypothetical protein